MQRAAASAGSHDATPSNRLRVLYVQPGTSSFAGIERVVDDVCVALERSYADSIDVSVLYTSAFDNFDTTTRPYHTIQTRPSGRLGLMATLRRVVGRDTFDVVVVPQIEPTVIAFVACLGTRARFVMHLHGNPRLESSHWKAKILFAVMRMGVLARLAGVFGTSTKQLQYFNELFPSDVPRHWVPNPVRRFDDRNPRVRVEGAPIEFVNVGRFSYQKGQDLLIEAFARLCRRRQDARLTLVGHGEGKDALVAAVDAAGLGDRVTLRHLPDNPQPAPEEADVFVSTSRWEGWSLAICEALRFGLPVVSTDCDFGPGEILTEPRLGRLVPVDDIDALVQTMAWYCENLADEAAHADVRIAHVDRFDRERIVHEHASALRVAAGVPIGP